MLESRIRSTIRPLSLPKIVGCQKSTTPISSFDLSRSGLNLASASSVPDHSQTAWSSLRNLSIGSGNMAAGPLMAKNDVAFAVVIADGAEHLGPEAIFAVTASLLSAIKAWTANVRWIPHNVRGGTTYFTIWGWR